MSIENVKNVEDSNRNIVKKLVSTPTWLKLNAKTERLDESIPLGSGTYSHEETTHQIKNLLKPLDFTCDDSVVC